MTRPITTPRLLSAGACLGLALALGACTSGTPAGQSSPPSTTASSVASSAPSSSSTSPTTPVGERWNALPPTPAVVPGGKVTKVSANGASLHVAEYGTGDPVFLLHGGPAHANYFGHQVEALQKTRRVIVVDTRGHGRSTMDARPLGYDQFADDIVAVMAHLGITKADFVGWSDGGITALDLAMRHPERVRRVVAFGANVTTSGTLADADKKPAFGAFLTRAKTEYAALSPTPKGFAHLDEKLAAMYAKQPNWTDKQLATITAPVLVMDGDHDEVIDPEHTKHIARAIPNARLRFLKDTSHFSFLQDPASFNQAVLGFLA